MLTSLTLELQVNNVSFHRSNKFNFYVFMHEVSTRFKPSETHLTLNGRNIPFVNHVYYLSVIFDKKIIWRLRMETTGAKAFRKFSIV
jgi:hypothetical protein